MRGPSRRPRIRVLLADDHPLVREGIRACLAGQPHIEVVGEAADGREAVRKAKELSPDVVLMDISMPGLGGLEAARRLKREAPKAKVLILSMHDDTGYIQEMVRSGAKGYILKDAPPKELVRAIAAVHFGGTFFSPSVAQTLLTDIVRQEGKVEKKRFYDLSPREEEVLVLVAEGLANKEAARRLGISVRTVETHRERIMEKLGIRTVAGLTKYAIAKGLVRLK